MSNMSNNNITDGTASFAVRDKRLNTLLDILYPIGSVKITVTDTAPFSEYGFGTWKEVSKGRVLWGADDSHKAGSTIEAGLPNITGMAGYYYCWTLSDGKATGHANGAFLWNTDGGGVQLNDSENTGSGRLYIDASRCSSVYGKSTTVTPPHTSFISGKESPKVRQCHFSQCQIPRFGKAA